MKWNASGTITAISFFFGIVVGLYAIEARLDKIAENKINSPDFLNRVAEKAKRPVVIFNQNGSVLYDNGAMAYISEIKVNKKGKEPKQIIISPNRHFNVAPILESLDSNYVIKERHGTKFDWIYDLGERKLLALEDSAESVNKRFRLEIVF